MEFYLIRHGDTDPSQSLDPYNVPLSSRGQEQAQTLADRCETWGIDMLCVSTMLRAMDTAEPIGERLPHVLRWDLEELEDLTLDDLNYAPSATHLVSTWTPELMEQGLISLWVRLTAAYARILLYAQTNGLERVAIVAGERVHNLLIANWLGMDWRVVNEARLSFDECMVCRVTVNDQEPAVIAWLDLGATKPTA